MNKEWLKKKALCLFDKFLDLVILLCSFILLGLLWKIFFFASFKVPSRSMEPTILPGDRVVVWKPWMGARLLWLVIKSGNLGIADTGGSFLNLSL